MTDRRDLPDLGPCAARCHGLAAYVRALLPSPKRGEPVVEPLSRLVVERLGRTRRTHRDLVRSGDLPDADLAWAWHTASRVVNRYQLAPPFSKSVAEEHARVSLIALYDLCLERAASLQNTVLLWDDDDAPQAVLDEYRLLAGVLALCLLETGSLQARRDVREAAAECLDEPDTTGPLRVVLGLSGWPSEEDWRPGQGCLGVLRDANDTGHRLLLGSVPATLKEDSRDSTALRDQLKALRRRDTEAAAAPVAPPLPSFDAPSLLVLGSVQHLPGTAEDGKDKPGRATGSNARSEYGPFAGRRWPLTRVPDLAAARAALVAEFPYAEDLVDAVLRDLVGRPHVVLRPLLLVGGPGSGKTRLARRLAEVLGLGFQVYGCAGVSDGTFIGTSRQWSTGRASVVLQLLKRLESACGLLVLDELEKAGTSQHNGNLLDALLPYLTDDAKRVFNPYLECTVDLSGVSYVATDVTGWLWTGLIERISQDRRS